MNVGWKGCDLLGSICSLTLCLRGKVNLACVHISSCVLPINLIPFGFKEAVDCGFFVDIEWNEHTNVLHCSVEVYIGNLFMLCRESGLKLCELNPVTHCMQSFYVSDSNFQNKLET